MNTIFKSQLTAEQSAHLISLGVSADKASYNSCATAAGSAVRTPTRPIFTLVDLFSLLPEEIKGGLLSDPEEDDDTVHIEVEGKVHTLEISPCDGDWYCGYYFWEYDEKTCRNYIDSYVLPCYNDELIDALYELLCKIIEHNLLTK